MHTGLDVAGFIPGVGILTDLANAGIYAAEGNLVMAGISAVAAVPGIGDGIKAGAVAAKAGKRVAGELAEKAAKEAAEKGAREAGEKVGKDGVRITDSGGKKARDSSKAERHGDSGRRIEKSKKQIEELEERLRNATSRREKKKLRYKVR